MIESSGLLHTYSFWAVPLRRSNRGALPACVANLVRRPGTKSRLKLDVL
jgi:hypothetical protein